MHGTSLLSTPGQFGPALLPYVNKNDDKELASWNNLALEPNTNFGNRNLLLVSHYSVQRINFSELSLNPIENNEMAFIDAPYSVCSSSSR